MENRFNSFAERGKTNIDRALNQIIRFLHCQKEFHSGYKSGPKGGKSFSLPAGLEKYFTEVASNPKNRSEESNGN